MTDRLVLDVTPNLKRSASPRPAPFSSFSECTNLVLLGDPGAGKTHLFEHQAKIQDGEYVKARSFLLKPGFSEGSSLFLDALDETRAGRSDQNTIDEFVKKLFSIRPKQVRVSCRAGDWLGDTDLAAFKVYFEEHGGVVVLSLRMLEREEQVAVLCTTFGQEDAKANSKANDFLDEAENRGLQEFTGNPQNLLMLWDAVHSSGIWPKTRKELFELSVSVLLREHNKQRQRSGVGSLQSAEVRDAAGALCALRLISNVAGISLQEGGDGSDFPSYRSLTFLDPKNTEAALGRRVFAASERPETVDYAHRTTAEFLGAEWIAKQVSAGLPIGRLFALTGVDGRPASELRGLHAWLAVFLPTWANLLADADPYGVLIYGDASALSSASRRHLMGAIAKLSDEDPGFRSDRRESPAIGMLVQPDMVDVFREILSSPAANFSLRSMVMDALAFGTPIEALMSIFETTLANESASFSERSSAATALERLGEAGRRALVEFVNRDAVPTENSLRLRDDIVASQYGRSFGVGDILKLLSDTARCRVKCSLSSLLWRIAEGVPSTDIPSILNAFRPRCRVDSNFRRWSRVRAPNRSIVVRTLEQMFIRYMQSVGGEVNAPDVLRWLELRYPHTGSAGSTFQKEVASALRSNPKLLGSIAVLFFSRLRPDQGDIYIWHVFIELVVNEVDRKGLVGWFVEVLPHIERGSPKQALFMKIAVAQCWNDLSWGSTQFEKLSAVAELCPELRPVFEMASCCEIEPWRQEDTERKMREARQLASQLEKASHDMLRDAVAIRSGAHEGWLNWSADIYFAYADFVDASVGPMHRVKTAVGEDNAALIFSGWAALLGRVDFPTPAEVAAMGVEGKRKTWWWPLLAAIDMAWTERAGGLSLSDDFWRGALAIHLINPIIEHVGNTVTQRSPNWREYILDNRPRLVCESYKLVAVAYLRRGQEPVPGLHELMHEPRLGSFKEDCVFDLLKAYPDAPRYRLNEMLYFALSVEARRDQLLDCARKVCLQAANYRRETADCWLVIAFLLSPDEFLLSLQARVGMDRSVIWGLRDLTGGQHGRNLTYPLSVYQLELLVRMVGSKFPNTPYPIGTMHGDQNDWDASDYVRALTNQLATYVHPSATEALRRLVASSELFTYSDLLKHALAQHSTRRRDAEYDRPDWERTITCLSNGRPINVGDLWALTLDHLTVLNAELKTNNVDFYKQFWNVDSYSRVTVPRPEEACRDALLTMIRPRLASKGISMEPEMHMAGDKRADVAVIATGLKIVIEIKKDTHDSVWHAAESQLDRLYTRDPEAGGFGIYCVFWFGDKRREKIPQLIEHPEPQTASEMATMIRRLLPLVTQSRIAVVVLDVSAP